MSNLKSIFLDIARLTAALFVVFGHSVKLFFNVDSSDPYKIYNMAHFAVVIFFVLSGYVIGFTTKSNNRGYFQYAIARLSRLSSMVIPALLFTFIVEIILTINSPIFLTAYQRGVSIPRYFITASFLNEIWFFSAAPPLNGPLWSVSFEFFYYFIFGVYFFVKGGKNKMIYTGIACLIAGPKIMLMLPIWMAGYFAYSNSESNSKFKNLFIFTVGMLITYISYLFIGPFPFEIGFTPFYFANQFITDWFAGFFFAFSLWAFPKNDFVNIPIKWVKTIRKMADFTFPIYVFHYPIILFCKGILLNKMPNYQLFFLAMFLTLLIAVVLGRICEHYRPVWGRLFTAIFHKFKFNSLVR